MGLAALANQLGSWLNKNQRLTDFDHFYIAAIWLHVIKAKN
jgi:hypothetical protein